MKILAVFFILISVLAGAAQTGANRFEALIRQGQIHLRQYEFEKASAAADEASEILKASKRPFPAGHAALYLLYGNIYEEGLYLEKAVEAYTTALGFDPKKAELYERRGRIRQYLGETSQADADFEQARLLKLSKKPPLKDPNGGFTIGVRSPAEVVERFQTFQFREVSGDAPAIEFKDADRDGKISDEEFRNAYIARLSALNRLVRFNPQSDLARWKRGNHYMLINDLSEQLFWLSAVDDFLKAFELNPRFEYLNNAGVVRAKRNNQTNFEFAVKYFSDALKINDRSPQVLYNRGLCYLKLSEYEKSIADLTAVVKFDPGFVSAYKTRSKALRAVGRNAEAEADEKKLREMGYF